MILLVGAGLLAFCPAFSALGWSYDSSGHTHWDGTNQFSQQDYYWITGNNKTLYLSPETGTSTSDAYMDTVPDHGIQHDWPAIGQRELQMNVRSILEVARFLALSLCLVPLLSPAEGVAVKTPWEQYLESPISANALKVSRADYSDRLDPIREQQRVERDLMLLEYEIRGGDANAFRLALRLAKQFASSASTSEFIFEMCGEYARVSPVDYLRGARESGLDCPGIDSFGQVFVDRPGAQIQEATDRMRRLNLDLGVENQITRDRCLEKLEKLQSILVPILKESKGALRN